MVSRPSPRELAVGLPAALVAGVFVGVLGTFKHQAGISAATGRGVPYGLAACLAMVVLVLAALRLAFPGRVLTAAAAVGVVAAAGVLALPSPGASQVILLNAAGIAWLVGVPVLAVAVVVWPRRRARADADGILEVPARVEGP